MRLTDNPADDINPMFWSPDGKWVYFLSERSGRLAVWKVGVTGEEPEPVLEQIRGLALLSVEGEYIYYLKGARHEEDLWRLPVVGGEPEKVHAPFPYWPFAPTERGIYFSPKKRADQPWVLRFLDPATGEEETVFEFPNTRAFWRSISPDGRNLLYYINDDSESDLMMVENFR